MPEENPYGDIIDIPRPPLRHRRMSLDERAAQFMPFAALTGYDEAVREKARLTERKISLDENAEEKLDEKFRRILHSKEEAVFTYFVRDSRKEGGAYRSARGTIRRIDGESGEIVLTNGKRISIGEVVDIADA